MLLQSRQPIRRCHSHKKVRPDGDLPLFLLAFADPAGWRPDSWHGEINTVPVLLVWKTQRCIQRWGKWQSSLHGTASTQTVACGEERRKARRNLEAVAKFKSWPSGTCRGCTRGPDYASSQTNRVETKLGYFMWERKMLKSLIVYSLL